MNKKLIIGLVSGTVLILLINYPINNQSKKSADQPISALESTQVSVLGEKNGSISDQTIILDRENFQPPHITIKVGSKVTWINKSGKAASVDSGPHPKHSDYPPLNFGSIEDGEFRSLIFDEPGKYGYHNHLKSHQEGTIIVER